MELEGAVALVTGGGEGIGRSIAEALKAEGAAVTITGRREELLRATAEEIGADYIAGDVGSEADAVGTVAAVVEKHGRLDILVNNAGYGIFKPLVEMTLEELEAVYRTNVFGAFLMAARRAASSSSRAGRADQHLLDVRAQGQAGSTAYGSSKFALAG